MIAATDTLRKELAPINDIEVVIKGEKSLWGLLFRQIGQQRCGFFLILLPDLDMNSEPVDRKQVMKPLILGQVLDAGILQK